MLNLIATVIVTFLIKDYLNNIIKNNNKKCYQTININDELWFFIK